MSDPFRGCVLMGRVQRIKWRREPQDRVGPFSRWHRTSSGLDNRGACVVFRSDRTGGWHGRGDDRTGRAEGLKLRLSRSKRQQRKVAALQREVTNLETLVGTLLDHLEAAIQPSITDRDRIRYRCMIQDIRTELQDTQKAAA